MTALSGPRSISERSGLTSNMPVAAGALIYQGALVVNDAGVAKPGYTGLGLIVIGFAEQSVDNTGGVAGAKSVTTRRGALRLMNLPADAVTAADIGKDAYLVDDQTVARTSGSNTRSVAGKVIDVDGQGVWLRVGF